MYIVDNGNHRIVLWSLGSTSGRVIAGSDTSGVLPSQLYAPYNIRLDSTGALIVVDCANSRIQRKEDFYLQFISLNHASFTSCLLAPNITVSSATSIPATLQNTTIAVPITTNSPTASANFINNSTKKKIGIG
ncbi:unnamed protein product [Adineta steineri]|nr:unnamed protein product [Adineta steineri]